MARGGRWDGVLAGCVGVVCFSGTVPATRVAGPEFGSLPLTLWRVVIAAALGLGALVLSRRLRWPGIRHVPALLLMGAGLAVAYPLLLAMAVEQVPSVHAAVVVGLAPAATAALAVLRDRERPPPRFWLGCLAGFGAVATYAVVEGGGVLQLADFYLVAAIASLAVGYVEGSRVSQHLGTVPALSWALILIAPAALVAIAVTVPAQLDRPAPSFEAWLGFWYVGVISMFVGSVAWYRGLSRGGTGRIGQLNLAQPFLAILWSAALLGEPVSASVVVTTVVVLVSVIVCISAKPGNLAEC